MSAFPIRYSEASPSGRGPGVPLNIDTRTGAPQVWGAIAQAGGELQQQGMAIVQKIQDAEDHIRESKTRLDIDGFANDYLTTAETTGDSTVRASLLTKAEQDIQKLAKTEDSTVYANQVIANLRGDAMKLDMKMRIREAKDQSEIVGKQLLEKGDLKGYVALQAGNVANGIASDAEARYNIEQAPVSSRLQGFRKAVASGNATVAKTYYDELSALPMSAEQLEYRNKLWDALQQQSQQETTALENDITLTVFKSRSLPAVERVAVAAQQRSRLESAKYLIPPSRMEEHLKNLSRLESGQQNVNSPTTYANLQTRVTQFKATGGDPVPLRQAINDAYLAGQLDDEHYERARSALDQEVSGHQAQILTLLENNARRQLAPHLDWVLELATRGGTEEERARIMSGQNYKDESEKLARYMDQVRGILSKNPDMPDLYIQGTRLVATYEQYTPEQVKTMREQFETPPAQVEQEEVYVNPTTGERIIYKDGKWQPVE